MTWGIRTLRLTLSLLVGASAVSFAPALVAAPAHAAPATCTTTYSAPGTKAIKPRDEPPGYSVDWFDIEVTDQRTVVDVDFGFYLSTTDATGLAFSQDNPQTTTAVAGPRSTAEDATGPVTGTYVIDDEASAPFAAVTPPSGRYRPQRPASELDGRSAAGRWRLLISNTSPTTGVWGNVTLTLTVDCDADKDGAADAGDNCPSTANPDQANSDDDALGNACDLDLDGDALGNTVDGCPAAAASTASGCPSVGRTASLRYAKATRKLKAVVRSDASGCRAGARVALFRARPGKDTKLIVSTTTSQGRKTWKAPKAGGRYYVRVASSYAAGQAECGRARSTKARVP